MRPRCLLWSTAVGIVLFTGFAARVCLREEEGQGACVGNAGPSGRTLTVEGVTFIELLPGAGECGTGAGLQPSAAFWIAETEVTNAQYERFRPKRRRSRFSLCDDGPVAEVDWHDAREYCAWLSDRGRLRVRLPTEDEWEFACRSGGEGAYCFGDREDKLGVHAWYVANSGYRAHRVKSLSANPWGLYDMHGNVAEWCEDEWRPRPDRPDLRVEGRSAFSAMDRVVRGGGWLYSAEHCRVWSRMRVGSLVWGPSLGFRPAADDR